MGVKIVDKNAGKPKPVCQYCQSDDLTNKPVIICGRCKAVTHTQCTSEHGGCPTPGCGRGIKVVPGLGAVQRAPEPVAAPTPSLAARLQQFGLEHPTAAMAILAFLQTLLFMVPVMLLVVSGTHVFRSGSASPVHRVLFYFSIGWCAGLVARQLRMRYRKREP